MLKRLLTTAATLGLLLCAATVGLEAVGVLFHAGGAPDPEQQGAEAVLTRLETEIGPADLPTEPVEFPTETAPEAPPPSTRSVAPAEFAPDAVVRVSEGPRPASPAADEAELAAAGEAGSPPSEDSRQPAAGPEPAPPEPAPEPEPPVIREADAGAAPPASRLVAQTEAHAAPAPVRPQRPGAVTRVPAPRVGAGRYLSFGCPFLDWLDAVIDPSGGPVAGRPGAARRTG